MMTSESIKQAFRENSEHLEGTQSNQRERDQSDFIIPSEPKILLLLFMIEKDHDPINVN